MGQAKRKRTAMLETQQINQYTKSIAQEAIEQHNFSKLVQQGVIVEERGPECPKPQQT